LVGVGYAAPLELGENMWVGITINMALLAELTRTLAKRKTNFPLKIFAAREQVGLLCCNDDVGASIRGITGAASVSQDVGLNVYEDNRG
jgi:hypothetical protein